MNRLGQAFFAWCYVRWPSFLMAGVLGPITLLPMLPGIIAGISVPHSGFELKTNHPLSLLAWIVIIVVDVALYIGLSCFMLYLMRDEEKS